MSAERGVSVDSVALGDEMRRGLHAGIGLLEQRHRDARVVVVRGGTRERVEGEHLNRCITRLASLPQDVVQAPECSVDVVDRVDGGEQTIAEQGLFAATGSTVPFGRRFEHGSRFVGPAERTEHASEMDTGERGHAHVADGFRVRDRASDRRRARFVVAGLTLGSTETGHLVGLGLLEAEPMGGFDRASDVVDGVAETMLEAGELARLRLRAHSEPGIVDAVKPSSNLLHAFDAASFVSDGDRRAGGEERVGGQIPRAIEPGVQLATPVGEGQSLFEVAVVGDDVREVVGGTRLQLDVADRLALRGALEHVPTGGLQMPRRRFDPAGEQQRRCRLSRVGVSAGRFDRGQETLRATAVAEHHPAPSVPGSDREGVVRGVVDRPGECGVDVGALVAHERKMLGLSCAAHALCRSRGRRP